MRLLERCKGGRETGKRAEKTEGKGRRKTKMEREGNKEREKRKCAELE